MSAVSLTSVVDTIQAIINASFFSSAINPKDIMVQVVSLSETPYAGSTFTLTCTVSVGVRGSIIVFLWPNGTEIVNGSAEGVMVAPASPFSAVLTFSPLLPRHEGMYTCMASLNSTLTGVPFISSSMAILLTVQCW